ncbi:MAG: hypothetical protein ABSF13_12550 [Smithella sp.]|jgi:hypothetical protein
MKRFWLVLLLLGLVMAFSVSAFAVDVKVSGEFDVGGLYLDKTTLNSSRASYDGGPSYDRTNPSTAFFYQKLQVGTEFIVSPSLKLDTRFNVMERIWGGARTPAGADVNASGTSAGTRAENENIAFDLAYIDYTSPIGEFKVGYQPDYVWGTVFGDRSSGPPAGQIQYWKNVGPATIFVGYAKEVDNSMSVVSAGTINSTRTDRDADSYRLGGIYNFKDGEAGILFLYDRDATNRGSASGPYMTNIYTLDPYVKAKIGPVALQAEVMYFFGDAKKWETTKYGSPWTSASPNESINALSAFLDATATFGMFNVGGTFAYLSGDDPNTKDKVEGGINTAGLDWQPCLILFNTDLNYWLPPIYGHSDSLANGQMSNAWFFQGRVGVKPMPKLDAMLSVSYATADKNPDPKDYGTTYPNGGYGLEVDATGTYKITDNLSYMLGIGYLFTGDFFKGYDWSGQSYKTVDDYLLINKLVFTF